MKSAANNESETESRSQNEKSKLTSEEEQELQSLPYFHGFVPREDLPYLLKNVGDYLVRVSEVENKSDQSRIKLEIILSVHLGTAANPAKIRKNIVIRHMESQYFIETYRQFKTIASLIQYYGNNPTVISNNQIHLKTGVALQKWELSHADISLGKVLGQGEFGEVREGTLKLSQQTSVRVAVKLTIGKSDLCKAKIKEMMSEARLMRNLKHRNIVATYGIAVLEQPPYIVMELVQGGSLKTYLLENKNRVGLKEKMKMCLDAGRGVEFMHKEKCIHRDIAARNCLYSNDKTTKITDFGMARRCDTSYKLNHKTKLPIKWLAHETMGAFIFTPKTDVYSFGCTVYEIFTDGLDPWESEKNMDVRNKILSGEQLEMPTVCPEKLRAYFRQSVFVPDPVKRKKMPEIVKFLEMSFESMAN